MIQDERMVRPLIESTGDESAAVREWAVRALGAYGDTRAIRPLRRLQDDPSPDVRRWVERALENIE